MMEVVNNTKDGPGSSSSVVASLPSAPSLMDSPGRAKIAVATLIQSFTPPAPASAPVTTTATSPGRAAASPAAVQVPPSPRSGPPTPLAAGMSPRKADRPRSRSGGPAGSASPLAAVVQVDQVTGGPGVDDVAQQEREEKKNESEGQGGGRTKGGGGDAGSPRSVGGKEWEWKRKALAGKGIVREGAPPADGEPAGSTRVKLPLASLLHTIETDRMLLVSSKSDTWKAKALTGRGIIPSPDTFTSSSSSSSSPSSPVVSISPHASSLSAPLPALLSPRQPIPSGPAAPAAATTGGGSGSGGGGGGDDGSEGEGSGSGGDRKKGNAGAKGEKRASRKENKRNNHNKVVTEVSLPTTVVNRVHVDKDNLAQDMDGVLRALHGELERLGNHHETQQHQQSTSTRGGGLRRHRRSKSIDQLAGHQALKPELKGDHKEKEKEKGSKAEAPAFAFPLVTTTTTRQDKPVSKLHTSAAAPNTAPLVKLPAAGEPRKTKTNSLRQQLLLGKGVVKPQDKRTVPVSRLSVLIDMADMQAIHQQASVLEAAARKQSSPSSPVLLSGGDYQPTKEDLVRQRLKTVKAVIASAMDELEYELLHQRNSAESASGEDQLIALTTKLHQLNDLLM